MKIKGVVPWFCLLCASACSGAVFEIRPAIAQEDEEFERVANALKPGDELILQGGVYSQTGRRAVTVQGTPDQPITIRAAEGQEPVLTRPAAENGRYNNIEFVDCCHLVIRGLHFQGGSSGVRFIRGHHVTFENCEICQTSNNALTMNSGNCDAFIIRNNHIHHTGLREDRAHRGRRHVHRRPRRLLRDDQLPHRGQSHPPPARHQHRRQ